MQLISVVLVLLSGRKSVKFVKIITLNSALVLWNLYFYKRNNPAVTELNYKDK